MSSLGQVAGGIVGGAIGFMIGGPFGWAKGALYGAQIGITVGGLIDPPKGPNLSGPRLSDLSAQTGTYGTPIPRIYGTVATHGNVIWLQGNKLTEVARKEKQGGKGGGGGATVKTYSYYATFAVGLADVSKTGPIQGVRRIWVGGNLIYDAGSDDLETIIASNQAAQGFRIYFGDDDQMPDPRMQADLGVANCPAYRGLAYIVFYDFALKDYGNSLMAAQVKVEIAKYVVTAHVGQVSKYTISSPYQDDAVNTSAFRFDGVSVYYAVPDNDTRISANPSVSIFSHNVLDGKSKIYKGEQSVSGATWGIGLGKSDRFIFGGKGSNPSVISIGSAGADTTTYGSSTELFAILGGSYYTASNGELLEFYAGNVASPIRRFAAPFPISASPTNNFWACYANGLHVYFGVTNTSGGKVLVRFNHDGSVHDYVAVPPGITAISVCESGNIYYASGSSLRLTRDFFSTSEAIYTDGNLPTSLNFPFEVFEAANDVICVAASGLTSFSLTVYVMSPRMEPVGENLSGILKSECVQSGLLSLTDIDASDIDQSVMGYRVSQTGAIRGAIEPLQGAWPFDVIQSGYKIKFVRRGKSPVVTVDAEQLDARQADSAPGVQITLANEMDTQLPRAVSLKYLDIGREYDLSEQAAERLNTDAVNRREIEMPIVLSANEAAGMSEVLLYLYWLERRDVSFSLPPEYRYLEPADVITVTGEWGQYDLRLTRINLESDGRLACSAKFNAAAIYTPTAQGAEGEAPAQTIPLDGPSVYIMLDVPLLSDSYNSPGWPAAMAGYTNGWPGGVIYRSVDGGQTWTDLQGFTSPVSMGYARGALGAGRFDIVDASSVLDVDMMAGDLSSIDELAQFAGGNALAYGAPGRWEICSPRTVTLNADGSLRMTDWLRGRFGTEWAASLHQSGDALVLLTDPDLAWISMESGAIGLARDYRGITSGRSIDTDTTRSETYSAVNLTPLSPVYLNGSRHPSTRDWSLSWTRRGRVSPDWRSSVDVPVGEASEAYEVEIYDGSGYATVKRTLTASTPAAAYTSAQQVTDFGANQATLYVRVYQISATVGRGYPLTTSITRG